MSDFEEMVSALVLACGKGPVHRVVVEKLPDGTYEAAAVRGEGDDEVCEHLERGADSPDGARYELVRGLLRYANCRAAVLVDLKYRPLLPCQ